MKIQMIGNSVSASSMRLVVSTSSNLSSPVYGPSSTAVNGRIRLNSPTLSPGQYYWGVERAGILLPSPRGQAAIPAASHKVAFGTCARTLSNVATFETIENSDADMFFHLGDLHYHDDPSTDPNDHIAHTDEAVGVTRQGSLYANKTTVWIMDDHDGGPDDRSGGTPATPASAQAWRERAPYPALAVSGIDEGHYFTFDVGRVRYIFTDQRRYASDKSSLDGPQKTILGDTQKAWFKNIIENSDGFVIVWCSSRIFHAVTATSQDHWGGFNTERVELCDHIKEHAPGRVIILTGDRHQAGIDDGSNCNYATGGDPLPICMGAPLDQSSSTLGNATFSEGVFSNEQQYGSIAIDDQGGDTINVTLAVYNGLTGAELSSLLVPVDLTETPPVNQQAPTIPETGNVGTLMSVTQGIWSGDPSPVITHQWYQNTVAVPDATDTTFTPTEEGTVYVAETGRNNEGESTVNSNSSTISAATSTDPNQIFGDSVIAWYDMMDNSLMLDTTTGPVTDGDAVGRINNKASGANANTHNLQSINSALTMIWHADDGQGGGGYLEVTNSFSTGFDDAGPGAGTWNGETEIWLFLNIAVWHWHGMTLCLPDKTAFTYHAGCFYYAGGGSYGAHEGFSDTDYYRDNVLKLTDPTGSVSKETLRNNTGWYMNSDDKGVPKTVAMHIKGGLAGADTAFRLLNQYTPGGSDLDFWGNFRDIVITGATTPAQRAEFQTWTENRRLPAITEAPTSDVSVLWSESQYDEADTQAAPPQSDPVSALGSVYVGSAGPDTLIADFENPDLSATALMIGIGDEPNQFYPLFWDGNKFSGTIPGIQATLLAARGQTSVVTYYYEYDDIPGAPA